MMTDISILSTQERNLLQVFVQTLKEQFDGQMLSVLLYGSRARGDAKPDSDMDIAVILSHTDLETTNAIRDLAYEIWLDFGVFLSTCVWSQAHWQRHEEIQTGLYRNIQKEGIDILSALIE